jgi:hypothetical protein
LICVKVILRKIRFLSTFILKLLLPIYPKKENGELKYEKIGGHIFTFTAIGSYTNGKTGIKILVYFCSWKEKNKSMLTEKQRWR